VTVCRKLCEIEEKHFGFKTSINDFVRMDIGFHRNEKGRLDMFVNEVTRLPSADYMVEDRPQLMDKMVMAVVWGMLRVLGRQPKQEGTSAA
jgi:hypothetical protein